MKIFYPKPLYDANYRGLTFPLLKPFSKGASFTDAQRVAMYGVSENDVQLTATMEEAAVAILPMAWQYHQKTNTTQQALEFIADCNRKKKQVWGFNAGDFGVKTPALPNVTWFRLGGNKSQFTEQEYTIPPFINDPLDKHYQTHNITERPYQNKPVIGFCGQANASLLQKGEDVLKIVGRNVKSNIGLTQNTPQPLIATSYLRASLLQTLEQCSKVQTNFIKRKQYRAGVKKQKDSHATTKEFYDTIHQTDYTLCVRGAGNFSVRFYETLAMGRIPILVDTDSPLPFQEILPWKKHVVWVSYNERRAICEKVKTFHQSLSETDFIALQHANRTLWEDNLTMGGFFKRFYTLIQ